MVSSKAETKGTYTDQNGNYTLENVPTGAYILQAQATITAGSAVGEWSGSQNITLIPGAAPLVENIEVHPPPASYRRADFLYSISCDHGDNNPGNAHGVKSAGPFPHSLFVNPGHVVDTFTYSFDYNNGGYFHIDYAFTIELFGDSSIKLSIAQKMIDDGSKSQQAQSTFGPVDINAGSSYAGKLTLEHHNGYHNGPANFSFKVTNNQQTG